MRPLPGRQAVTAGDVAAGLWYGAAAVVCTVVAKRRSMATAWRLARRLAAVVPARPGRATAVVERRFLVARRLVPWGWSCVGRSVTLAEVLRRDGHDPSLRIGVSATGGFGAHAWVTVDGRPVLEAGEPDVDYASFDRPIDAPAAKVGT